MLIKANKGRLSVKATDLDLEVIDSVTTEVSPGGTTTVPRTCSANVRKLPEGAAIVIKVPATTPCCRCARRSRFTLQTLPKTIFQISPPAR